MKSSYPREDIAVQLISFIRERFLSGDPEGELDEDTPLLEFGILNSLNTATLIAYMRDQFDVTVPLVDVTAATFQNVGSLSDMLHERLLRR